MHLVAMCMEPGTTNSPSSASPGGTQNPPEFAAVEASTAQRAPVQLQSSCSLSTATSLQRQARGEKIRKASLGIRKVKA